jgi:hypothetical protein
MLLALQISLLAQQVAGRPLVPPQGRPEAHTHALMMHEAPATQALPQPPQCASELVVFVSQPFIGLTSQLP